MNLKRTLSFVFVTILTLVLSVTIPPSSKASQDQDKNPKAAFARGAIKLDGEDVVVEILAEVRPGEHPQAAAKAALRRAYPNARELDSSEFSLTGLVWDQFKDSIPGNEFVTVNYNPRGVPTNIASLTPSPNHRETWLASMATWTNVESSKFTYSDGGNTIRCPSLVQECRGPQYFDGYNDVGWIDIKDPSVLGVTWYSTTRDEFDMALDNRNFNWYIGNLPVTAGYDAQTVWLHEFGHGAGLGHSSVDGAVMEPYYEGARRVLHQDDINGITYIYP